MSSLHHHTHRLRTATGPGPVRFARADGARIAWRSAGAGPVDVVLVPGFASHVDALWEAGGPAGFLERLSAGARVIVYDRRGQGRSTRGVAGGGAEQDAADLAAVLDAAGVRRAVVAGLSQGGAGAIAYAATAPERVAGLVLFGAYARAATGDGYPHGLPAETLVAIAGAVAERWGSAELAGVFAPSAADDPEFLAWWASSCRRALDVEGVRAGLERRATLDVRRHLAAIRCPALVLHRSGDRITPVEHGRYLADHIRGARLEELPGEDHLWWFPDPATVADLVLDHARAAQAP